MRGALFEEGYKVLTGIGIFFHSEAATEMTFGDLEAGESRARYMCSR